VSRYTVWQSRTCISFGLDAGRKGQRRFRVGRWKTIIQPKMTSKTAGLKCFKLCARTIGPETVLLSARQFVVVTSLSPVYVFFRLFVRPLGCVEAAKSAIGLNPLGVERANAVL
jgi:hypothetical protein